MTVVGRNPSGHLREQVERQGITVTGTVADVRPFLAEGEVYVVPLRVGGGTRLKIFEALAMGKAVVSTRIGAEGLGLTPGRHYVAADEPDDMVHAISTLLDDTSRRRALEVEGAELVRSRYGWDAVTTVFAQALERATRGERLTAAQAAGPAPA
jgi:glycosyltransferase involved in cell wall biosynthesis